MEIPNKEIIFSKLKDDKIIQNKKKPLHKIGQYHNNYSKIFRNKHTLGFRSIGRTKSSIIKKNKSKSLGIITKENIINLIRHNKSDVRKIRSILFLKAYEHSELFHKKKQDRLEKLKLNKYNKCIEVKDAKEKERLKLLKLLKSYNIKYEGYTNLYDLCDYSIYFSEQNNKNGKEVTDSQMYKINEINKKKKDDNDNFLYYLVSIGISYNDIIEMASVFENMKYLKYCNLYMLPWIYKKVNEFHNYDVNTFVLYCVVYSITTLSSSLYLFIKYKTIAIIFPLFITYMFFSAPFLLQEINGGRFVLDGCISFFNSINSYHLPIAISLLISYILSIIKCIDSICLHLHYFSYYFIDKNPWVYKNLNNKICSKFNGNKNICNIGRNICSYNITDGKCEINTMKLSMKMYDTLLRKYTEPKTINFGGNVVLYSFLFLFLYNSFSKYKSSNKLIKLFTFLIIFIFTIDIISLRDFSLLELLSADLNISKIFSILSNHEVWISCMIHCIVNMSFHSGIYFYTSKGLRLGIDIIYCTYLIVMCCFLFDILIFITFSVIIGKNLKNIENNYYFLLKLIKRNFYYILVPVAHNYYNKFTLFLSIIFAFIYLTFMLISASKRIDILFLSLNDIFHFRGPTKQKMITLGWIFIFCLYYIYRSININYLDICITQLSHIIILLILFYINFNFFWIRGIKKTAKKIGLFPLALNMILIFLNEFTFMYFEIFLKLQNRVLLYFIRQFINIFIIPLCSIFTYSVFQCIACRNPGSAPFGLKEMTKSYLLIVGDIDKSKHIQLEFKNNSKYMKWFNIYLIIFFRYFAMDLIFMCFLHLWNEFLIKNEAFFNLENVIFGIDPYLFFFLLYVIYVYICYLHVPLLILIKKKKIFKVNNFNILDYPIPFDQIKQNKKNSFYGEFSIRG
ncbi:amino acid transporter, putative [Plasmodium chabaudi adami]|uniref:Amino acid transporter, putative n=1 Tax=Plasmodium chabaudi adami TaxID=5826 RepID=A0A1C6YG06_PLACE|nr:amino acid transporter, putative [Plasmodium chabaudi adami]